MLFNDPRNFRDEMVRGYVKAFCGYIMEVPGGVVSAQETPKGKIAVINGGGSGHYPAFCGIVGQGFMDGTVVGNIFTSPSTEDVYSVAKAVENGAGIFIVGGNYAGDKMNFNLARDRLIAEGIDARTFYITDDIASASKDEVEKRRGNVGTFTVFKAAGAAAAAGYGFDDLERVTSKANDMTRTMSIGFRGCKLPGETEPKFHVPAGKMEVGQGIHGEAGVYEDDLRSAAEIGKLLVERVLSEKPDGAGKRIAVILDGLGATKYEELFVVWGTVADSLEAAGYELVEPQVGEFVTSLDMEGIALAVTFLDDELEKLWKYPCNTPAFRKGNSESCMSRRKLSDTARKATAYEKGSEASIRAAEYIVDALERVNKTMIDAEAQLAKIDSVAGDGDHGRGMVRGTTYAWEAAREALANGAAAGSVLAEAGRAWAAKAGGTSGVLWGAALESAGAVIGDHAENYDTALAAKAVNAAANRMMELGGAKPGDKTMLDALLPFANALNASAERGETLGDAWEKAAAIAQQAAEQTKDLLPRIGRARPQAERSLGTPDAGAVSMAMCIQAAL